jgi:pteridine reductase
MAIGNGGRKVEPLKGKVALITGGVRRIGAAIARTLHDEGMNLVLHYRSSIIEAEKLRGELSKKTPEFGAVASGRPARYALPGGSD